MKNLFQESFKIASTALLLASCTKAPKVEKLAIPINTPKLEQTNKSDAYSPEKIIEREKGFRITKSPNLPKVSQSEMFIIVRKMYEVHSALPEFEQPNVIDLEESKKQAEYEKMFGMGKDEVPKTLKNIDHNKLTQELKKIDIDISCRLRSTNIVCQSPSKSEIYVDKMAGNGCDIVVFRPMNDTEYRKKRINQSTFTDGQKQVAFFRASQFGSDTPKGYFSAKDSFTGKKIDVPNSQNEAFAAQYSRYEPKSKTIAIITNTNSNEIGGARKRVLDKIESQIK
jgi:hypothetical protein